MGFSRQEYWNGVSLPSPFNEAKYIQLLCCIQSVSHVRFFVASWTVVHQAPLSMEFSRQEYWSGLPFPTPGKFPDPGIEPMSLMYPALAGRFFTTSAPREAQEVAMFQ